MKSFLFLLSIFVASTAYALEIKTDLSGYSYMIAAEDNPILYQFSDGLLNAAENCQVYSEDFSKNNPDLVKYEDMFGGSIFAFINIKGKQDNKCVFDVNTQYGVLGHNFYHCQLSDEQRNNLVSAMKDRTNELVTESYEKIIAIKDEKGNVLRKEPQQQTLTSNHFNVEWLKTINQACDVSQNSFSESEQLGQNFMLNELPFKFVAALKRCLPASASRHLLSLDIKGWVKGECFIEAKDFTVSLPPEMTKKIKTWDNMYDVIKNENFTHYRYAKTGYALGFLLAIKACSEQEKEYEFVEDLSDDYMGIKRGVRSQFSEDGCSLQMVNQISFAEDVRDYGKTCHLYPIDIKGITKKYSELIDQYNTLQTQEEKDVALETSVNIDIADANKEIMAYLNEHNFCRNNSLDSKNK